MAITRTYGSIVFDKEKDKWIIEACEPHVSIKLKAIFSSIPKTGTPPYQFANLQDVAHDLHWFMERYPLAISSEDDGYMLLQKANHISHVNEMEQILLPSYKPSLIMLRDGKEARKYQVIAKDYLQKCKKYLLGDDMGLGKTVSAIISMNEEGKLPSAVVVQAHLTKHWKEKIEEFTNLKVHIIKTKSPYSLPEADVYVFTYSKISSWVTIFSQGFFKSIFYDEAQELRVSGSDKYCAARKMSSLVPYVMALSGTPIYNYGIEAYNVFDAINPGCMGDRYDFVREWTSDGKRVSNPQALGSYLREQHLMLRRTRQEVGRELPAINKLVYTVDYDHDIANAAVDIARMLAIKVTTGSFIERGSAARDLDTFVRHQTGVAKARSVASFVKILLDNNEPVLLGGWHREVYDIWAEELKEYNPVFYTGSESPAAKERSKEAFVSGATNLMIMSLRSGTGVDGLQYRGRNVVYGELDWSPKIHDQFGARIDRDGQTEQVNAYYLVSDDGSDPIIMDILGLKASQAHGIVDPLLNTTAQYSDESRIKLLAERYLSKLPKIVA